MTNEELMTELSEWSRIAEEAQAQIEGLKDVLKSRMQSDNVDTIQAAGHTATYKPVKATRMDVNAIKQACPDIYRLYSVQSVSMRFTFK